MLRRSPTLNGRSVILLRLRQAGHPCLGRVDLGECVDERAQGQQTSHDTSDAVVSTEGSLDEYSRRLTGHIRKA